MLYLLDHFIEKNSNMQAISIYIFLRNIYIYLFSDILAHVVFHNVHSPFLSTLGPHIREVVSSTLTRRSTGKLIEGATVGV
jgi:hypothetical protein